VKTIEQPPTAKVDAERTQPQDVMSKAGKKHARANPA